jgi:hypothetical protein
MRKLLLPVLLFALCVVAGCGAPIGPGKPVSSDPDGCPACTTPSDTPSCCEPAETPTVTPATKPGDGAAGKTSRAGDDAGKADSEGFRFPDDAGGALLLKILTPTVSATALLERTAAPRRKSGPARVEDPTGPLPPTLGEVPRLPLLGRHGNLAPRLTVAEALDSNGATPAVPTAVVFPEGQKVKAERLDPGVAPDLPILGQPVPDRASLDDATRTQSLEAAVVAPIPGRETPAPFIKQTIPDPFANRKSVQFTTPLTEPAQPVTAAPQPPKP